VIFSNKTRSRPERKRSLKAAVIFSTGSVKIKAYKRKIKQKKNKSMLNWTSSSYMRCPKKEKNVGTHQMTRQNNFLHHRSHPHASPKVDRVADTHALTTFCFFMSKDNQPKTK
jgi:PIN domain nuclease of toxin-antitoxin system